MPATDATDKKGGRTTTTSTGLASVGPGEGTPVLLLTAAETSKALSLSARTIWSLTASGELPSVRIGRSVRYSIDDLREWVDKQKRGGDDG